MNSFIVSVVCAAHLHSCPIPNGYKLVHEAPNREVCVKTARDIVSQVARTMGLAAADFTISCREK